MVFTLSMDAFRFGFERHNLLPSLGAAPQPEPPSHERALLRLAKFFDHLIDAGLTFICVVAVDWHDRTSVAPTVCRALSPIAQHHRSRIGRFPCATGRSSSECWRCSQVNIARDNGTYRVVGTTASHSTHHLNVRIP
jgi:hypothetical protein